MRVRLPWPLRAAPLHHSRHFGARPVPHAAAAPHRTAGSTDGGGRAPLRGTHEAFTCPACGNASYVLPALWRHLERCCPDLWSGPEEWQAAGADAGAMRTLLHAATAREAAQRSRIVRLL